MIRTLLERSTRHHRTRHLSMGASWRAIDDDPVLLCGCEASSPGADPGTTCSC